MIETTALPYPGLSDEEAARRLAGFGPNLLAERGGRSLLAVAARTLREPMFLLLLAATALYLIFGGLAEGLFLLAGAVVSIGLVIFQEARSERALAALNALAEPVVRVVRGGSQRLIPASELVPDDLFVVAEGSRLPADATLVAGDALTVDESALTGEAAPVTRCPGGDEQAALSAGTMVTRGNGFARVTRTGAATRFGKIGAALATISEEPTLLQRNVGRLIARLGVAAMTFCVIVTAAYGWLRDDWLAGALAGITLAIALLPEEFPMVLAVFMALGAWRLAQRNVLVRHSAVIETLGATTLLCVDKTGTLTGNRMTLAALWTDDGLDRPGGPMSPSAAALLRAARLASAPHSHDAMDAAVHAAGTRDAAANVIRSYPLRPERLAFVQVWRNADDEIVYAAKGAPETIIRMCRLDQAASDRIDAAVAELARRGMRVLGVAEARLPHDHGRDPDEIGFAFLGLLGFTDPVRADVPAALAEARLAGVRVIMVTGDYPATALAIAREAGIDEMGEVVMGDGFDPDANVFARIMPEQKLALVERFKAAGHVVAMTGDGINDAPALAAAHIGIAMGRRGTDVAREAADLILLDDRFASIVGGIALGRRIFANLRRAMTFITAIHVPIAGLALLPLLFGMPPLLFPMHVVLLELIVDPICSLAFEGEPGRRDDMRRPPRPAGELLFGSREIMLAALQGGALLAVAFGLYAWTLSNGTESGAARALTFTTLVVGNLGLALANAAGDGASLFQRRLAYWGIGTAAVAVLIACLAIPTLRETMQFASPDGALLALAVMAGGAVGLGARIVARLR